MTAIIEPATLVTDYLLAAFTAWLAWRLRGGAAPQRWWALGLAATSLAGLTGGTVHGFVRLMPEVVTTTLWLLTLELLVLAALAVVAATIVSTVAAQPARRVAVATAGIAAGGYALWLPSRPVFAAAIVAYGGSLLILAVVEARRWFTERARASSWLLAGVGCSIMAAVVQQSEWAPHRHFNHNDLFHVIQAAAIWFLYGGATRLRDARDGRP